MEDLPISFDEINRSRNQQEDDGCIPVFHSRVIEDQEKSRATGKREYMEVPYVRVLSPGNDKEIPDYRVTDVHKKRWPRQWDAFQRGCSVPLEGTPLELWTGINRVEAKVLQDAGILTVDELVKTPDLNLKNIGKGFITLKHRAEAFLTSQDGEAGFQKLKTENDELRTQVETLTGQLEGLEKRVEELSGEKKGILDGKLFGDRKQRSD